MTTTVIIGGVEYAPVVPSSLKIVRATRGYRDYIYVGHVERLDDGDVRVSPPLAVVRQYREKGLTGAASDPSLTTLDRGTTAVVIRGDTVVDILDCAPAWEGVL